MSVARYVPRLTCHAPSGIAQQPVFGRATHTPTMRGRSTQVIYDLLGTSSRGSERTKTAKKTASSRQVVDTSNSGSSGAGWAPGEDGLPSLPVTTVAGVLAVGVVILELVAHAPILSLFLPRVLQVRVAS